MVFISSSYLNLHNFKEHEKFNIIFIYIFIYLNILAYSVNIICTYLRLSIEAINVLLATLKLEHTVSYRMSVLQDGRYLSLTVFFIVFWFAFYPFTSNNSACTNGTKWRKVF